MVEFDARSLDGFRANTGRWPTLAALDCARWLAGEVMYNFVTTDGDLASRVQLYCPDTNRLCTDTYVGLKELGLLQEVADPERWKR